MDRLVVTAKLRPRTNVFQTIAEENAPIVRNADEDVFDHLGHQVLRMTITPEQTCFKILDHFIHKDDARLDTVEQALNRDQSETRPGGGQRIGIEDPNFRHVTKEKVEEYLIHKIKVKRAPSPDEVPGILLRTVAPVISDYLAIRRLPSTGVLP